MATCQHRQHTSMCASVTRVMLCLLFHVHLHLAHASDMSNGTVHVSSSRPHVLDDEIMHTAKPPAQEPSQSNFVKCTRHLFEKYAKSGNTMTLEEFEQFLAGLGLGGNDITLHSHQHASVNSYSNSDKNEEIISHLSREKSSKESSNMKLDSEHDSFIDSLIESEKDPSSSREDLNTAISDTAPASTTSSHTHVKRALASPRASEGADTSLSAAQSSWQRARRHTFENHAELETQCLSGEELLSLAAPQEPGTLDEHDFASLYPVLLHQLEARACQQSSPAPHRRAPARHFWQLPASVWLLALAAITAISLVGLLAVAIIPLTSKVIYNHLLQFLVALAVGSLTGDACLHLLPHAMSVDTHAADGEHGHNHAAVYKGLVALGGIYFFFIVERLMRMYSQRKQKQAKRKRAAVTAETELALMATKPGQDAADTSRPDKHAVNGGEATSSCGKRLMVVHKDVAQMAQEAHDAQHADCGVDVEDSVGGHHGHSHGPLPRSVAEVAWMVIMGDGIHNFGDGLAIGAAFASSVSVGLSTTVAVFCHELPHEIGDFAVLLRAGMSPKQAIVYNLLSSVLALVGMFIGLLLGNISTASLWIFALIGGMFIYVALVDMVPELTALDPKSGEHPLLHFMLQNAGMLLGAGIMLVIALYEDHITLPALEL